MFPRAYFGGPAFAPHYFPAAIGAVVAYVSPDVWAIAFTIRRRIPLDLGIVTRLDLREER